MAVKGARIDAYLVCGGWWHDFDFVRFELLKLLAEDDHVRVKVAQDFADIEAIAATDFLVSYTCDVRPTEAEAQARCSVGRRRWPVVRPPRHQLGHRPTGPAGRGPVQHPAGLPGVRRDARQPVPLAPGHRPLPRHHLAGGRARSAGRRHRAVRCRRDDELYLCRVPRRPSSRCWRPTGSARAPGFAEPSGTPTSPAW